MNTGRAVCVFQAVLLLISASAWAAYTAGSTSLGKVSTITHWTSTNYVGVSGTWTCPGGGGGGCSTPDCASGGAGEVLVDGSTTQGKAILSTLLAAKLAGRDTVLWLGGCANPGWTTKPLVTAVQLQ